MNSDGNKILVLVVDDHPVVAEGTVSLLSNEPRISVLGTAKNGEECLKLAGSLNPDVVLLDINLPDICGVDLVEKLREIQPQTAVIMITGQNPQEYVNNSLVKGARGFLLKDCSGNELIQAVLRVFEGEIYFSQSMGTILRSLVTGEEQKEELCSSDLESSCYLLTPRETEIMKLVANGLQNKEIAGCLGIKRRTVDYHIGNVLSKLGASSRLEAVIFWRGFK